MQQSVLIAGCGDLGNTIGERLLQMQYKVFGLRRNIDQLSNSIQPIACDLLNKELIPRLPAVDYIIFSAAATSRDLENYREIYVNAPARILSALPSAPKRIFMLGSTGVYAQNNGERIDETSETQPDNPYGELLLEAEIKLRSLAYPTTITRCSGIYGPGREHLLNRVRRGIVAAKSPIHYSNRIHRDDAARFLAHLIQLDNQGTEIDDLYLVSDDQPTPISNITLWLAEQLAVQIQSEEMIRRGGSKRICNRRMLSTGFELRYPSFREGFGELLNLKP